MAPSFSYLFLISTCFLCLGLRDSSTAVCKGISSTELQHQVIFSQVSSGQQKGRLRVGRRNCPDSAAVCSAGSVLHTGYGTEQLVWNLFHLGPAIPLETFRQSLSSPPHAQLPGGQVWSEQRWQASRRDKTLLPTQSGRKETHAHASAIPVQCPVRSFKLAPVAHPDTTLDFP